MKFISFILINSVSLFISLALSAEPKELTIKNQTINISLQGIKKPLECSLDNFPFYICKNENHPIIIKYNKYKVTALGKDEKGNALFYQVKNLSAEKVEYYKSNISSVKPAEDLSAEYMDKIAAIKYFFNLNDEKRDIGSNQFESLFQEHFSMINKLEKTYDDIFTEKNYTVELENGKKISCTKGVAKEFTEKEKANYKNSEYGIQCGSFKCEAIVIKGKTYIPTLIYGSSPYSNFPASLHLVSNGEIGPQVSVRKVFSKNSKKPLNDYSEYISTIKDKFDEDYISNIPEVLKDDRQKIAIYKDNDLLLPLEHYKKFCSKDDGGLRNLIKAKEKLLSKLANLKLKEFIQIMADGKLMNELVDVNKKLAGGCNYEGIYLSKEAAERLEYIKKNIHADNSSNKTISLKRANELFKKALAMKDISWKYKDDGCVARAHLMARRFEAEGVHVDKVWIKGNLYIPELDLAWDMHVAPIVYVEDQNKIQKMVIDPSLFDRPVTVEEWDKKLTKKTTGGTSITAFPMPDNSAMMERASLAFSSSDAFHLEDTGTVSEETKMKQSMDAMLRNLEAEKNNGL
jgi:ribosomal protein S6E (S10)